MSNCKNKDNMNIYNHKHYNKKINRLSNKNKINELKKDITDF